MSEDFLTFASVAWAFAAGMTLMVFAPRVVDALRGYRAGWIVHGPLIGNLALLTGIDLWLPLIHGTYPVALMVGVVAMAARYMLTAPRDAERATVTPLPMRQPEPRKAA